MHHSNIPTHRAHFNFAALLDRISLDSSIKEEDGKSPVYLLTMHNAKGLEFPTVITAGINSTYMPFFLRKEIDEIKEERRLFYVASTRAVDQLIVSTGSERPSRFLAGIRSPLYTKVYSLDTLVEQIAPQSVRFPAAPAEVVEERFIKHPVFGRGKIINAIDDTRYVVHFVDRGEKVLDTSIVAVKFL
ncbi:MAG: ATP-binding domain-containing protein [Candidatus Aminicenantes bacterium]|nr:ATP-binding domain-containing protein [Candidatus Aminicenantes bacterium]